MIFVLAFLFWGLPAFAYDNFFSAYSKKAKVPKELAVAIARQESGLNPNCVNVEGDDLTPATREEAVAIIRLAQAQDKSYDVGLMQINSQWVKAWNIDPTTLLDPETNIRLGIKILRDEIDRHGMNWLAVGKYHSPDPFLGRQYACMVSRHIKGNAALRGMIANPRLGGCTGSFINPALMKSMLPRLRAGKRGAKNALLRSMIANPRLGMKGKKHSKKLGVMSRPAYSLARDKSGLASEIKPAEIRFSRPNMGFDSSSGWRPGSLPRYGYGQ